MLSGLESFDGKVAVPATGRHDADGIDIAADKERVVLHNQLAAQFLCDPPAALLIQGTDRHQFGPWCAGRLPGPVVAHACSNDGKANLV